MDRLTCGQYLGQKKFQQFVANNNIVLTQSSYQPYTRLPIHFHENFVLGYVNEGSFSEKHGQTELECDTHSLMIQPSQVVHENRINSGVLNVFNIEINNHWWENARAEALKFRKWGVMKSPHLTHAIQRIKNEVSLLDDYSPLLVECQVMELMVIICRGKDRPAGSQVFYRIKQIKEKISDEWYVNHSLHDLSKLAGIHPLYLAREFKKYMHCSIGEFARDIRIKNAARLLHETDKTINEIAFECGFSDSSHFIRTFKKKVGCTPLGFRNKN